MGSNDTIDDHDPQLPPMSSHLVRPVRRPALAIGRGVGVVLGFLLVQVAATLAVGSFTDSTVLEGDLTVGDALSLGAVQAAGIVAAAVLVLVGVTTWRRMGATSEPGSFDLGWRALLPVGLLVIAPTFGAALVSSDPVLDASVSPALMLALVLLAILIAVNEELWFRGLLVDQLQTARQPWLTIGASAILFGLPHVGDTSASLLNAVAVTLAVGIPFSIVRLKVGSLWPLIAWHALIDTWAFLHTASVVAEGTPSLVEAMVALVLPALVAIGYLWWYRRAPANVA